MARPTAQPGIMDIPPYVGGLIGATLILICGAVAAIWWRRKKRAKASALRRVAKAEAKRRAQLEVVVDMRLPGVEPQTWTPVGHYRTRHAPTPPRLSRVEETNEQRERQWYSPPPAPSTKRAPPLRRSSA